VTASPLPNRLHRRSASDSVPKKAIKKGMTRARVSAFKSKWKANRPWLECRTVAQEDHEHLVGKSKYRPCFAPGVSYPTKTRPIGGHPHIYIINISIQIKYRLDKLSPSTDIFNHIRVILEAFHICFLFSCSLCSLRPFLVP
jgi:hypothetical protein